MSHKMAAVRRLFSVDITGTCLKVRGSVGEIYARFALKYGVHSDAVKLNDTFRNAFASTAEEHPNFGLATGMSSRMWWREVVCRTFSLANVPMKDFRDDISDGLYEEFCEASSWEVYPDTVPFLEEAVHSGHKLSVLSNFDERLDILLQRLNLSNYFSKVIASRSAGYEKPDPMIFQLLMEKTGVDIKDITHIGDSMERDYLPAKRLGMNALLLVRGDAPSRQAEKADPNDIVTSLSEVLSRI